MKYFSFLLIGLIILSIGCSEQSSTPGSSEDTTSAVAGRIDLELIRGTAERGMAKFDMEKLMERNDTVSRSYILQSLGEVQIKGRAGAAFAKGKMGLVTCSGWEEDGNTFYFGLLHETGGKADFYIVVCDMKGNAKTVNHFGHLFLDSTIKMTTVGEEKRFGLFEVGNMTVTYVDDYEDGEITGQWEEIRTAKLIYTLENGEHFKFQSNGNDFEQVFIPK